MGLNSRYKPTAANAADPSHPLARRGFNPRFDDGHQAPAKLNEINNSKPTTSPGFPLVAPPNEQQKIEITKINVETTARKNFE